MRSALALTILLAVGAVAPAHAAEQWFGAPRALPRSGGADWRIVDAASSSAGVALATQGRVAYRRGSGAWHGFAIVPPAAAVRVAAFDDGSGMAAWDADASVLARSWDAHGVLGPVQTVLRGVQTVWDGDFSAPEWLLQADRRGTAVLASAGSAVPGVHAAIRDPGGAFGVQQLVAPLSVEDGANDDPHLSISPIAADGGLALTWGRHGNPPGAWRASDETGRALRPGRAAGFGPPQAPTGGDPAPASTGLAASRLHTAPLRETLVGAAQSAVARVGADVVRLCHRAARGCATPIRLDWPHAHRLVIATLRRCCGASPAIASWHVARADARGVFRRPVIVPGMGDADLVVRGPQPGAAEFVVTSAVPLFGRSAAYLVPFGAVAPARRQRLAIDPFAVLRRGRLLVDARCLAACTVSATAQALGPGHHPMRPGVVVDPATLRRLPARLAPLGGATVAFGGTPASGRVRVTVTARQAGAPAITTTRVFRRTGRGWCARAAC